MADIAASVLTRLKNKAQASGRIDDFNTVLKTIKEFLIEPYKTAVADIKYTKIWLANNNSWIRGGNNNG